jgi:hypothetical protein
MRSALFMVAAVSLVACKKDKAPAKGGGAAAKPTVTIAAPVIAGGVNFATAKAAIDSLEPRLVKCYADGLAGNPKLGGTMKVKFGIEGNGNLSEISADHGPELASIYPCVADVFRGGSIPDVKDSGTSASVELTFAKVGGGGGGKAGGKAGGGKK